MAFPKIPQNSPKFPKNWVNGLKVKGLRYYAVIFWPFWGIFLAKRLARHQRGLKERRVFCQRVGWLNIRGKLPCRLASQGEKLPGYTKPLYWSRYLNSLNSVNPKNRNRISL